MMNTATATEALPIAQLASELEDWANHAGEGTHETNGLELLGIDEDEAVARYGVEAADRLCYTITASLEYHVAYRGSYYEPEEGYCYGNVWIDNLDGDCIAEGDYAGEDGLDADTTKGWWN